MPETRDPSHRIFPSDAPNPPPRSKREDYETTSIRAVCRELVRRFGRSNNRSK